MYMSKKSRLFKIPVVVCLVVALSMNANATSSTKTTTEATTEANEENKADAQAKLDEAQEILDALETDKANMVTYVQELDTELSSIQIQITDLATQQADLEDKITKKQAELTLAKEDEAEQYAAMKTRLQYIYENGDIDYFNVLFEASDMSDVINNSEYVSALADYDYDMLTMLISVREDIAEAEAELQVDLTDVQTLITEQEGKKATVESLIETKNAEIDTYNEAIGEQSELVAKYEADVQAIEDEMARLAALEKAANGGVNLVYTGGALLWPCPASSRITSPFGPRVSPTPGASTNHKGIDIGVASGNAVIAAAGGTVEVATYSSGAGNYVVINHGGGLRTVYMHNSVLYVSPGQTVSAGETISLSGNTGISTAAHLHFGVSSNGVYVDPMSYLGG